MTKRALSSNEDLPKHVVFVTGNKGKLEEVGAILSPEFVVESIDINLVEIQGTAVEIVDAKCKTSSKIITMTHFVEDTSLFINGWNGLPGPYIKSFLSSVGNDGILGMMSQQGAGDDRGAKAVCNIGLVENDTCVIFTGTTEGFIPTAQRGNNGFGWDSIFEVETANGELKTFAQMTKKEKNEVSPRRKAVECLKAYLMKDLKSV